MAYDSKTDKRGDDTKQLSNLELVRKRPAMYLGTTSIVSVNEYLFDKSGNIVSDNVDYSPAATKCFDELLVNAIDQNTKTSGKCVDIYIECDDRIGRIRIENTGTCIPLVEKTTNDGRKMWMPQFIFSEFNTSSNYNEADQKRITGGAHGLGGKLVPAFSIEFVVETSDPVSGKYYRQVFRNCLRKIEAPEIEPLQPDEKPSTCVTAMLNLSDFEMSDSTKKWSVYRQLAYMRAVQTAVWVYPRRVFWNESEIKIQLPMQIMSAYMPGVKKMNTVECNINVDGLKWRVSIGIQSGNANGFAHMTLVNGVYTRSGGSHVDRICDQIAEYCREPYLKIMKRDAKNKDARFQRNNILKYIYLFMMCEINNPSYPSQTKNTIDNPVKQFTGYQMPDSCLKAIWEYIHLFIKDDVFQKQADAAAVATPKRKKGKPKAKKYTPAVYAGTARAADTSLFIGEGDTAVGMLDRMINSRGSQINSDYYGIFSIQGVPVNARKETTMRKTARGVDMRVRSKKLLENERICALIEVLGLDRSTTYDDRPSLSTLNYGCVVIATDQDEDGKGNIRSQILNLFQTEWPALIRHGFVKFLITPLIRAYHLKGTRPVEEFMTERDRKKWQAENTGTASEYKYEYYKGLGTHSKEEVEHMAKGVLNLIITMTPDADTEREMERYFGKDPDLRKDELKTPPLGTEAEFYVGRTLMVSKHLKTETKSFQLHNIARHLPHFMDGMCPTNRKVICGARKKFAKSNKPCKVYQLTGYITEKVNYHQGDASASGVIIGMAQNFPGSNEFPFLRALSEFGSRKKGGTDAGSARYINTKLTKQLVDVVFPSVDDFLLDYTFDDGKRGEPIYYVPVMPIAILENYKSPATGWATTIWARNYDEVSRLVRACVEAGEFKAPSTDFSPSDCRTGHELVYVKDVPWSLGRYKKTDRDEITVTALPIRKWNEHLINGNPDVSVKKKKARAEKKAAASSKGDKIKIWNDDPNIADVIDKSDADEKVDIRIRFASGFLDTLTRQESKTSCDPVIEYLGLKQSLKSSINLIGLNGTVVEFGTYTDVVRAWFPIRKALYKSRLDRRRILAELELATARERLRFAKNRHEYKLNDMKKSAQVDLLKDKRYQIVDTGLLREPLYTKTLDLKYLILSGPGASHDYLLKMNSLATNTDGIIKLEQQIRALEETIANYNKDDTFPGRRDWLAELDALDAVVKRARKDGWGAWDVKTSWR